LKIAYVATSKIPSREANSIHVMKMCSAFAAEGNDVTLFVPETDEIEPDVDNVYEFYGVPESFKIKKVKLLLPNWKKGRQDRYSFKIANYICRKKFDFVIGRDKHTCYMAANTFHIPVLLERHAPYNNVNDWVFLQIKKSDYLIKLIVITEALKEYFIEQYQMDADKIYVAPDGADKLPESIEPAELIDKSKGLFHVGYIGHLYKGRGIELIEEVAQKCPYAFFHIIGGKKDDIIYWRKKTEHLDNIYFYGFVPPSEAARYGISMDVLIAPYQKEIYTASVKKDGQSTVEWMSPLKIFEYMAMGKPIISSDIPVLREVLEDGVNGLLCIYNDADAWCDTIERLYKEKELSKQLSEDTLKMFEKYTWRYRAQGIVKEVCSTECYNKKVNNIYIIKLICVAMTTMFGLVKKRLRYIE